MEFFEELKWRGLLKDISDEEAVKKLLAKKATVYCGYDPSASSMQLGNFVLISLLRRLQLAGHRVIALTGGGTGMIGDPSGKSKERNLLENSQVKANADGFKKQLSRYIDFSDPKKGLLVDNYDWLHNFTLIEFLRDYGKYFQINYMLGKDIIRRRLDAGISYAEFSYTILQAVDFLKLYQDEGCKMQIGGSDQWGNLTSGLELIRKVEGGDAEVGVFTVPLLLDENGKKFGKSEHGAMYLDAKLFSPYKLYQYFINSGDEASERYLKVFSFKSVEEIKAIIKEHEEKLGQRIAQKAIAYEIVSIIHGKEVADEVVAMSQALFSGNVKDLSEENILELFGDYLIDVKEGTSLEDALILIKAAKSKREAREFISGNSVSLNGDKCQNLNKVLTKDDALFGKYIVTKRGKKNYYLIHFA